MTPDIKGLITCSRYSFAPNSLHYCGPERQNDMLGYVQHNVGDEGLFEILNRFDTLYKYLVLIAQENNIRDPFDRRVVEAYWLGNGLLRAVKAKAFASHLTDSLELKKKIPGDKLHPMVDRIASGVPHHTFHVLNVFLRTGHVMVEHTLKTMDNCRISWGKIVEEVRGLIGNNAGKKYLVERIPLVYQNGKLRLGMPTKTMVTSVSVTPKPGEWVSIHWGYVCDRITRAQLLQLAKYTDMAIVSANKTI